MEDQRSSVTDDYGDNISQGIVPTDDDPEVFDDREPEHRYDPKFGNNEDNANPESPHFEDHDEPTHAQFDQPPEIPPLAPPPLVEDELQPSQRPLSYRRPDPTPFFRPQNSNVPTYYHNDEDEPTYPIGEEGVQTPPTTPISGGVPALPVIPPPSRSSNTTPQPHATYPRDTNNLPARTPSILTRNNSTLPRDHMHLRTNNHGEMDRSSAKNTIVSYKTDRTILDLEERAKARPFQRSALTHLICGLYALILVVVGLVFSLSTALTQKVGEDTVYLQVFLLYIYGISLIFLIYLHCCLLSKTKSKKSRTYNGPVNHVNVCTNNQTDVDKCSIDYNQDADLACSVSKDKPSRSRSRSRSHFDDASGIVEEDLGAVTFDAEGINFYLRLGAIGFGLGSMIHDGFRIASLVVDGEFSMECRGPLYIAVALSHMVFTFIQTFYIFKNHKIVIHKHKAFVRFGLMHMAAANLCVWCITTVSETADSMATDNGDISNNSGEVAHLNATVLKSHNCESQLYQSLASMTSPFLFPCTIEYSLIAAAVIYRMYSNVGKVYNKEEREEHTIDGLKLGCHKANKGLFLGLLVAVLTLIAVSCFFVFRGDIHGFPIGQVLFFSTDLSLLFICAIVVLVGFARLKKLRFNQEITDGHLDIILLVISFFGICVYNIFLCVSSIHHLFPFDLLATLTLTTALLGLFQSGIQTIFIMDGLRRCAGHQDHVDTKPGRALVTFLLLCNLSLWVVNTFEIEKADKVKMHQEFFGVLPWEMITYLCIPLMIFFRFHSTVCLCDIWINAYKIKKDI